MSLSVKSILLTLIPFFSSLYPISIRYGLDPILISSQVKAESNFKPDAVSHAGAIGLMQVMPSTARWLGFVKDKGDVKKLYDPNFNLIVGCHYDSWLRRYWARRGWDGIELDLMMLASYNAGPGRVGRDIRDLGEDFGKLPQETRTYIRRIFRYQAEYLLLIVQKMAERR